MRFSLLSSQGLIREIRRPPSSLCFAIGWCWPRIYTVLRHTNLSSRESGKDAQAMKNLKKCFVDLVNFSRVGREKYLTRVKTRLMNTLRKLNP